MYRGSEGRATGRLSVAPIRVGYNRSVARASSPYTPDISIIIPVFNARDTLERAIDSIRNQTIDLRRLETILVDDASTDGSGDLIQEFERRYPFCRSFSLSTYVRGAGAPRNVGLDAAHGRYVMFLDADDEYEPWACETLLDTIEKTGDDVVSSEYAGHGKDGVVTEIELFRHPAFDNVRGVDAATRPELFWPAPALWSRIYRKAQLHQNGVRFPENTINDDACFVWHAMLSARSVTHLRVKTVRYHRDVHSRADAGGHVTDWIDERAFVDLITTRRIIVDLFKRYSSIGYADLRGALDAKHAIKQLLRSGIVALPRSTAEVLYDLFSLLVREDRLELNDLEQLVADLARTRRFHELARILALVSRRRDQL